MNKKNQIDKNFVSEIDQRLAEFDRTHAKTPAQQAEIKKYNRIAQLRDTPIAETPPTNIWD